MRSPFVCHVAGLIPAAVAAPQEVLSTSKLEEAGLAVTVKHGWGQYVVDLSAHDERPGLTLHWAINDWVAPPQGLWPPGTAPAGDKAVETPFAAGRSLTISFPEAAAPAKLVFVLREGERWINSGGGGDFAVYLKPPGAQGEPAVHLHGRWVAYLPLQNGLMASAFTCPLGKSTRELSATPCRRLGWWSALLTLALCCAAAPPGPAARRRGH